MVEEVKGDSLARVEELKQLGNQKFKEKHFGEAIAFYTQAIELDPSLPVLYSNRSLANLKVENYGFAEKDASEAIRLDPNFIKGYYRRGSANFAMCRFKEAIKDLKAVCKIVPNDKEAKNKLRSAQKEFRALKFAEALEMETPSKAIDIQNLEVPDSYTGPRLPEVVTPEWVQELMEYFKNQKQLHKKYVLEMLIRVKEVLSSLRSLVYIDIPQEEEFTVCGDVHGQFYDLLNIFELNGVPSPSNPFLFNGDFVDRGSFSVEVMLTLFAWKLCYPEHFHLLRGNHETKNMNKVYGFEGEVHHKYDTNTMELFSEIFCYLPLAAVLNSKVMVTHGGLFSQDGVKLSDIENLDRVKEPPDSGIMCELLWSDPIKSNGRHPSKRGVGLSFGPDVAHRFLDENNLELLVRSHEVKEEGYEVEADGRVITIFSAPNYCDQMGNKGAVLKFKGNDMKPQFKTFTAVPHPNVPAMAYAKPFMFM